MGISSRLRSTTTITAEHEGEASDFSKGDLIDAIKIKMVEAIREEADDSTMEVKVSVYVSKFAYTDNGDDIKNKAKVLIDELDIDQVEELLIRMREER